MKKSFPVVLFPALMAMAREFVLLFATRLEGSQLGVLSQLNANISIQ